MNDFLVKKIFYCNFLIKIGKFLLVIWVSNEEFLFVVLKIRFLNWLIIRFIVLINI